MKKVIFMCVLVVALMASAIGLTACFAAGTNENKTDSVTNESTQEVKPTWKPTSPEIIDYSDVADEISVFVRDNFNPNDQSGAYIEDESVKKKILNMTLSIYDSEEIYNPKNIDIPKDGCYRRVDIKGYKDGELVCDYMVCILNSNNEYTNLSIVKGKEAKDYLLDEKLAVEFSELCGVEQPIIKID